MHFIQAVKLQQHHRNKKQNKKKNKTRKKEQNETTTIGVKLTELHFCGSCNYFVSRAFCSCFFFHSADNCCRLLVACWPTFCRIKPYRWLFICNLNMGDCWSATRFSALNINFHSVFVGRFFSLSLNFHLISMRLRSIRWCYHHDNVIIILNAQRCCSHMAFDKLAKLTPYPRSYERHALRSGRVETIHAIRTKSIEHLFGVYFICFIQPARQLYTMFGWLRKLSPAKSSTPLNEKYFIDYTC